MKTRLFLKRFSNIPNVSPHARHKTNNKQNKELRSDSFIHFIDPAYLKNKILKYYTITNASFTTKKRTNNATSLYIIGSTNNTTLLYINSMHKQRNLIVCR